MAIVIIHLVVHSILDLFFGRREIAARCKIYAQQLYYFPPYQQRHSCLVEYSI